MAFEFLAGKKHISCFVVTIKTPEGVFSRLIDDKSFTVGRSPDCTLSFPDPNISRTHCLITYKSDQLFVIDQASSNGTFLNGEKVVAQKMTAFKPTDLIKIGISELYLKVETIEKVLKVEELAKSLLPDHEKNKLLSLIEGAQQNANRMMAQAQEHTDKINKSLEQRTKAHEAELAQKREAMIAEANAQAELIKQEGQKQCDLIVLSAEQKAIEATRNVVKAAEDKKNEADKYYKEQAESAKKEASEIIAKGKVTAQEHLTEARAQYDKIIAQAYDDGEEIKKKCAVKGEEEKQELLEKTKKDFDTTFHDVIRAIENKKIELEELEKNKLAEMNKKIQDLSIEHELKIKQWTEDYESKKRELIEFEKNKKEELEKEIQTKYVQHEEKFRQLESNYEEKDKALFKTFEEKKEKLDLDFKEQSKKIDDQKLDLSKQIEELKEVYKKKDAEFLSYHNDLVKSKSSEISSTQAQLSELTAKLQDITSAYSKKESEWKTLSEKQTNLIEQNKNEENRFVKQIDTFKANQKKIEEDISTLEQMRALNQQKHKDLEQKLVNLQYQLKEHETKIIEASRDYESQKSQLKKNLENDIAQFKKERDDSFKLQIQAENERVQKAKEQIWTEIAAQQKSFVQHVHQGLSVVIIQNIQQDQFRKMSSQIEKQIDQSVSQFLTDMSLTQQSGQLNLNEVKKKQKKQQVKWLSYGLATGLSIMLSVNFVKTYLHENSVQTILQKEKMEREAELQARRFEPEQELDVKETYTKSVIYTKNFVAAYSESQYQDKWFKAARDYLYTKWRVQEETSIEVLAMAKTLVATLEERRREIHPDFVKQNIEKMEELEQETLKKMEALLGTEVKLQAFKKFEKKFFDDAIVNMEMNPTSQGESPQRGLSSEESSQ